MKQPPKTIVRGDRGQALVEFALTLPMLLVVMFMITEFGMNAYLSAPLAASKACSMPSFPPTYTMPARPALAAAKAP